MSDLAKSARTMTVVATRYVYHTPGKPPYPPGTTFELSVDEARYQLALHHVRLPSDNPKLIPGVGEHLNERGELIVKPATPPPLAPPRHSPEVIRRAQENHDWSNLGGSAAGQPKQW